jgi:hypothetical protein
VRIWRGGIDAEPKSLLTSSIKPDEIHLMVSPRQDQNFLDAVKSRKQPVSNLADAVRSDLISQLCNIAVRLKRPVTWDPAQQQIVGDAEAAKMSHREMREPWTL